MTETRTWWITDEPVADETDIAYLAESLEREIEHRGRPAEMRMQSLSGVVALDQGAINYFVELGSRQRHLFGFAEQVGDSYQLRFPDRAYTMHKKIKTRESR